MDYHGIEEPPSNKKAKLKTHNTCFAYPMLPGEVERCAEVISFSKHKERNNLGIVSLAARSNFSLLRGR